MLEIAYALSFSKFDDIKGYDTTKKMWNDLQTIYGGDANVLQSKSEILRGELNDMMM